MPFELTIVTPQGEAFRGSVERVVLPGSEGEFGVLASHERFLCPLKIGEVEITTSEGAVYAAIADGFAEVSGDEVAVLVESCDLAHEIDQAEAEAQVMEAQRLLERVAGEDDPDRYRHFEAALERARSRVAVAKRR